MTFGKLTIEPAKNPAVLDTATWDPPAAVNLIRGIDGSIWRALEAEVRGAAPPANRALVPYPASFAVDAKRCALLARLADGQKVFVVLGEETGGTGLPAGSLPAGSMAPGEAESGPRVYPADEATILLLLRRFYPHKAPRALGAVPRLGIGTRMTTAMWPGVWRSMNRFGYSANAIQNSVRELNVLEDLLRAVPPRSNVQFGFGSIQEGHTGSTHEGLWVAGVLDAIGADMRGAYGADADHIMVKRGAKGLDRAKRVIKASRNYTFFTLDVGDTLDYTIPGGNAATTAGLERKYRRALDAAEELTGHIRGVLGGRAFDLELSIDETPPEVSPFDHLTSPAEMRFLAKEAQRRGIPLTHIAPNFGVEKGVDYRGPDGVGGFEKRAAGLCDIAAEYGLMPDCHSGDDLSRETRRAVGRASKGRMHFKVSPSLQLLFAEVLAELLPEEFRFWWDDAVAYASAEAGKGSELAVRCLKELGDGPAPSPERAVFHHFSFATVGRRSGNGQFLFRERFYDLPSAFYEEYTRRLEEHLGETAGDVLGAAAGI